MSDFAATLGIFIFDKLMPLKHEGKKAILRLEGNWKAVFVQALLSLLYKTLIRECTLRDCTIKGLHNKGTVQLRDCTIKGQYN